MTLLPITANRTSTPLSTARLLQQLAADQLGLQRNFDQLSTGRRITSLGDDPAAAGRALSLSRDLRQTEQVLRNANATETYYNAADTALDRVTSALIEARAATVSAAQNVISDDERVALATTIEESIRSVFTAGNTVYRDHQILGGILGDGTPYAFENGTVRFSGDNAVGRTELGAGRRSDLNVTGNDALGSGSVIVEGGSLGASVDRSVRLADLAGGRGVQPGVVRVSGGGNFQDVDLSEAFTVGDVIDVLSSTVIDGRQLIARTLPDGIRVGYADNLPGTLLIQDGVGSETARQLNILNPDGLNPPPLTGDGLTPRITSATKIADLNGGAGLNLADGLVIDQGEQRYEVDFAGAETIGDVLIAINRSGADVRAELDPAADRFRIRSLRSGVDYSIGENGGLAATNLRLRSASEATPLSEVAKGRGIIRNPGSDDVIITRPDGIELALNLDDAQTVGDVIDLIRNHPDNQDSRGVTVNLNAVGNGLQLSAPPTGQPLRVQTVGASDAAIRLGWVPLNSTQATSVRSGAIETLVGDDFAPRDAGGTLDTLLRLKSAVADGDLAEISRLQAVLDDDLDRAIEVRGRVGVYGRNLQDLRTIGEDRQISLEASRSEELDADLASVIAEISQRQLALEASMRLIGQTANLTVLNFI